MRVQTWEFGSIRRLERTRGVRVKFYGQGKGLIGRRASCAENLRCDKETWNGGKECRFLTGGPSRRRRKGKDWVSC